jgi:hypothetical protein
VTAGFAGRRLTLVFDGVDHECEVWLNGKPVGCNAGMFRRFRLDVTAAAQPGRTNRLALRVARIPEALVSVLASSDEKGGPNVGAATNAIRKVLKELKSPTNCAWDWAVAVWTLGIWKDVRLEATGPARIEWVRVQSSLSDSYRKALVQAHLQVDSLVEMPAKVEVRIRRRESGASGRSAICPTVTVGAVLKRGKNLIEAQLPLDHPALWWPNGQGEQPLYELLSMVTAADTGEVVDRRTTRFGVREIRWEQCPGAPADFINPLKLVVNGRPVRQMGSNLVPPDILFGRIDQRGPRLLELARAAGINCLRVWGGGVIFSETMYDRADELGIMLLHEFPLANNIPETDTVFLNNLEATITNILQQTRNHPCIVEWTGGNEMPWQNGTRHPALQLMEKLVREQDGRIFRATEPAQGSGPHGTYTYVYHTEPAPYLSWLGAGGQNLYQRYNTCQQMRISEFGTNSPANLEVWHREVPPSSQWPLTNYEDPVLIRKNAAWGAVLPQNWLHKEINERVFGPAGSEKGTGPIGAQHPSDRSGKLDPSPFPSPDDGLEQIVKGGQFLGAEGLRYAMDALRRKGPAMGGGFMSWNYNEPWPNAAGSYMVDYDGRPLMNYDFVRQALAPLSLSLQYDSLLYDPATGVKAELWIVSDAPQPVQGLRWQWLARDRRGQVFARDLGTAAIGPQEAKRLGTLELKPPAKTALGPIFVEMMLHNAAGSLLGERMHVFGVATANDPLGGLLRNRAPAEKMGTGSQGGNMPVPVGPDKDDDTEPADQVERPDGPANLAFVGNGAKPATATSSRPEPLHQPAGLNDGRYGNDRSWIGGAKNASFQIDLGKPATVGRFKLGRDRTGHYTDRGLDCLKVEVSTDGRLWQTVFEKRDMGAIAGYSPTQTVELAIPPVQVRYVRGSIDSAEACLDEFEVYAPREGPTGSLPRIAVLETRRMLRRPVARTVLQATSTPVRHEGGMEVLELVVRNTGAMTALFCEPHPLIEYRTDLFIDNNNCFIPPGQSRTITIRAAFGAGVSPAGQVMQPGRARHNDSGLGLAQTGWRFTCWNADDVVIEPSSDVLLAVGRRDAMCREFFGYQNPGKPGQTSGPALSGKRPDPSRLPYLLGPGGAARFTFEVDAARADAPSRLRLHTADQAAAVRPLVVVSINGAHFQQELPSGLGLQRQDPSHLAFPATVEFQLPKGTLRAGSNVLEVRLAGDAWYTWDALDLLSTRPR